MLRLISIVLGSGIWLAYSYGIFLCAPQVVFFEMNYVFMTGAERIAVLEALRTCDIIFPDTWDQKRTRQKKSKVSGFLLSEN